MATLWKRALPQQYRMMRIVRGAVLNAAHAHGLPPSKGFANSVAKRAIGTLTGQWPEVLAAAHHRRQLGQSKRTDLRGLMASYLRLDAVKGGRLRYVRRSPLVQCWKFMSAQMTFIKHNGSSEEYEMMQRVLRLLDQAQKEYETFHGKEAK